MLTRGARLGVAVLVAGLVAVTAVGVTAATRAGGGDDDRARSISVRLSGFEEDPLAFSSSGVGMFRAWISDNQIRYRLAYANLEGDITQAHIHLGGVAQSGGISVFLCSNLGNGPAGTQACPAAPASISGTIVAADVIGPTSQGIAAGEFGELLDAIAADTTYVNVHTTLYQLGEIRSQLDNDGHHHG